MYPDLLPYPLPLIYNYNGLMPNTTGNTTAFVDTYFNSSLWNITKPLDIFTSDNLTNQENFYDMMQ